LIPQDLEGIVYEIPGPACGDYDIMCTLMKQEEHYKEVIIETQRCSEEYL
jgi:hypothetical protein